MIDWDLQHRSTHSDSPLSRSAADGVVVGIVPEAEAASLEDIHWDKMHPAVASAAGIVLPLRIESAQSIANSEPISNHNVR